MAAPRSARLSTTMPLPVYTGPFGPAQAERLLWRAGFGPRPGEERSLAARGLDGAVVSLLQNGPDRLVGRSSTHADGQSGRSD